MYKKSTKRGGLSIWVVLSMPVILLFMFMIFDYLNYAAAKQAAQRQLDSAALTIAQAAMPSDDTLVDIKGNIIYYDGTKWINTHEKPCKITNENYQKGINQLNNVNRADVLFVDSSTTEEQMKNASMSIHNISTQEQMDAGVVRIQATGYVSFMLSNVITGNSIRYPYVIESYATCSSPLLKEGAGNMQFTVNYVVNGGVLPEYHPISYKAGEEVELPVPTYDGSVFLGWYETADFSGESVTSITADDLGNKTYYAKWDLGTYTTKFKYMCEGTLLDTATISNPYGTYGKVTFPEITGYNTPEPIMHSWTSGNDEVIVNYTRK